MIVERISKVSSHGSHAQPKQDSSGYQYALVDHKHARRAEVERFIASRFAKAHEAHINAFMPDLIAVFDEQGNLKSAIGVRSANSSKLFLEHYLDAPVEQSIAAIPATKNVAPLREEIAEVGNLASCDRIATRRLFELLAAYLIQQRYQWIVFTGCGSLRRVFKHLHLPLMPLATARQSCLPAKQQTWGHYYEDDPKVMVGQLLHGRQLAQKASLHVNRIGVQS